MIEEWILLFKRVMTLCLALMLMAVAAFAVMPGAEAAEAETDVRDFLDAFPMKNISYKYNDDQSLRNGTVWFSQALLLQDSRDFSGEMAKASVAMAMAAYSESCVDDLLLNMGFTAAENTEVYDRSLNGLTAEDFDRVAYTIAYQDVVHPVTGETYRLYAVPVKGASANAEWFSDFNMGAGEVHEGFYKASMEVRTALETAFAADGMDADHRIVWFTGHSRGAACANLLAGWFSSGSQYTKAEHVFGYTFACPAVSTNADTALKNIYNFNNPGDLVPMLPLTQWGFGRNGQTIQLDTSDAQMSNVRLQFKNTFYANYAADTTDQQLQAMLLDVFGDNRQNFNCSRTQKLILDWVAYFMGGKSDVSVKEVLVKNGVEVSDTVGTFINDASLTGTMSRLNGAYSKYTELAQWAHDAYLRASDMTEAEFKSFLSGSHNKLAELKRETAVEFDSVDDFQTAENVLVQLNEEITSLLKPMESAKALVANDDGKVRDAVLHGHTQSTYTVWINSLYYGYRGWYNNPEVQSVTIDSSTLSIGNDCFCGCAELAELTLPDEQVALGRYSFGNCKGLRTVTLPVDYDFTTDPFRGYSNSEYTKGVTTIRYTYGQTGIMLDRSTSSNNAYYYERSLEGVSRNSLQTLVFADGITYIGNNLMYPGSSTLKTVEVPDSVTAIGERSFYGCSALTDAVLHEGLQTLGNHAFSNCSSLTSLTIPVSMQTIGSNAFSGCSSVVELTIPNTTVKMSNGCFANMKGLRTVTLPVDYDYTSNPFSASSGSDSTNGVTTIHYTYGQTGVMSDRVSSNTVASYNRTLEYASRNAIESIDFEDGITYVGSYLFYPGSASLNQITLPNSMQSIGNYAFYGCTALSSIDFNENLERLGDHAFEGCKSFPALPEFPERLTTVGASAFANCDGLQELTIPTGVSSIGSRAFYGCDNLKTLTIPDIQLSLGSYAFGNCKNLRTVTLPVDYDFSNNPFAGSYTSEYTDGVTTVHFTVGQTGVMTDRTGNTNNILGYNRTLEYASRNAIQSIDFEEGITHVGNYLLYPGSSSLTEVSLPDSLLTIGSYAFCGCAALPGIDFNENLERLGDHAFDGCKAFTALPEFPEGLHTVGAYAFADCDGLTVLSIPKTVSSIGQRCFYGCDGLQELTIPNTVLSIGSYAFGNCKNLRTVTLPVDYDFSNNPFAGSYTSEYTDGVTTVHFTVGQTGIMTDRMGSSNSTLSHNRTLVYHSRNAIQSIDFEEGITHIGSYFLSSGSISLTTVTLPATLQTIGERGFYSCKSLKDIQLPAKLTGIGSYAFYDCDSFTVLPTLPASLTAIGNYAFYGCDSMTEMTLPNQKISLGSYAFGNCKALRTVTLPVDYDINNNPFGSGYTSERTDGVTTIHFTCGQTGVLPDRLTNAYSAAYYGKTLEYHSRNAIETIDFAQGVTAIGEYFISSGSTSLQVVNFPSTLQSIGNRAFNGCTANATVTFSGNAPTIGAEAFKDTTATCRYPAWLNTWTADVMQNYGGTLTWIPYRNDLQLKGDSFTLSFEDEVLVNFYYSIEDMADVTQHGVLVFNTMPDDLSVDKADAVYNAAVVDAAKNIFFATTDGIAAKQMGDARYYVAYAIRGDGECFFSNVYDYSPKKYAMNMLGKNSTSQKQKVLCVALLNYGAAAQEYFNYRTDDLMNKDLTDAQKALVKDYDKSLFTGAVAADPAKVGAFVRTADGFTSRIATVSFEGAFVINYYLDPEFQVHGDMKLYIWNPADYASAAELTEANASAVVTMAQQDSGAYWGQVTGIAAKMLDETYYVAGVYTDAAGNTYSTGIIAYSLSRYCMNNANGTMANLAQATAMYGYYAKAYFA